MVVVHHLEKTYSTKPYDLGISTVKTVPSAFFSLQWPVKYP